ncbi:MAG: hypothetical protein ACXWOH_11990 [Bdellovibrionota bacterium]
MSGNCPVGGKDCQQCASGDAVACGARNPGPAGSAAGPTSGFANSGVASAGTASDLLTRAKDLNDGARALLSGNQTLNGRSQATPATGSGDSGLDTGLKTEAAALQKLAESVPEIFDSSAFYSGHGAASSSEGAGPEVILDGSGLKDVLVFDGKGSSLNPAQEAALAGDIKNLKTSASQESAESKDKSASGSGSSRALASQAFDPNNPDTWPAEIYGSRLKAALDLSADQYFALIGERDSIFKKVHERYQTVDNRWQAPALVKFTKKR